MSFSTLPKFLVGAGPEGVGVVAGGGTEGTPADAAPNATTDGGTPAQTSEPEKQPDGPKLNEFGYPDGVPLTEMTATQQANYWKRMSRKHEQRADQAVDPTEAQKLRDRIAELENATLSAEQVAAQQQIDAAREEARTAAVAELMPVIHNAQLLGYASTVISGDRLQAWVESANPAHFLSEDGAIDGEKVQKHLVALFGEKDAAPPAPKAKYPNFGQSAPVGGGAKPQRGQAGREEALKRFAKAA